jgi:riboflavin biosynthesis pyrimidine reductase
MNRPEVVIIQEVSVDGKLAVSVDRPLLYGDERWEILRGSGGTDVMRWLLQNRQFQATLEGRRSFVREMDEVEPLPFFDEEPHNLYADYLPEEIVQREDHIGWFMAVDSQGRVRWLYKDGYPGDDTWRGWHLLVLVSRRTPVEYLAYLQREKIPYLVSGDHKVDLEEALEKAYTLLGVKNLLSTAGGVLNGHLLKAGLVDEINLQILPGVIGDQAPASFKGFVLGESGKPVRLSLLSCMVQEGGQVWLRYRVDQDGAFLE